MAAWVIVALVVAGIVLYVTWAIVHDNKKTKAEKAAQPKHNYGISKRTYLDGEVRYVASYKTNIEDLHGDVMWFYVGKTSLNGHFRPTEFTTAEEALEAAKRHYGNQLVKEEDFQNITVSNDGDTVVAEVKEAV